MLLSLFPPIAAYAAWLAICEACLLWNMHQTYRRAGGGLRGAVLSSVWLCFSPLFLEFWVGQFTFFLGTLLFYATLALEEGHWQSAQRLWLLSVLWKPASLLWAPIWLHNRRFWRGLAAAGLLLVVDQATYFALVPGDWQLFSGTNFQSTPTWHAGNIGLSALIYQFTGNSPTYTWMRWMCTAVLLVPLLLLTVRPIRPERAALEYRLRASLWTLLYFLLYKDVWEHHLTLLLPFLILALLRAPSPLLWILTLSFLLPSPFVLYDLPRLGVNVDPQPYWSFGASVVQHAWRVVPLVILYGTWLYEAFRTRPELRSIPVS